MPAWTPTQQQALALATERLDRLERTSPDSWRFDMLELARLQAVWSDDAGFQQTIERLLAAADRIGGAREKDGELSSIASVVMQAGGRGAQALAIIDRIGDSKLREEALKYALADAAWNGDRETASAVLGQITSPNQAALSALIAAGGDNEKSLAALRQLAGEAVTQNVLSALRERDLTRMSAILEPFIKQPREEAISEAARRAIDAGKYDMARWLWDQYAPAVEPSPYLSDWSADDAIAYAAAASGNIEAAQEALTRVTDPYQRASVLREIGRKQNDAGDHRPALLSLRAARDLVALLDDSTRDELVKSIARELSRAGACDEALVLAALCGGDCARLLSDIARDQAWRGDYAGASSVLSKIPDAYFADECRADIIAAKVAAGQAPPSRLGQIADPLRRRHMTQEAAYVARKRGDTALARTLLAHARAGALIAQEGQRDNDLAGVAEQEIKSGFLKEARATIGKIMKPAARAESLSGLAWALAKAEEHAQSAQMFAEAAALAVNQKEAATAVAYNMIAAGFAEDALALAREQPRASRERILRHLAVELARRGEGERAFAVVREIKTAREQIHALLEIVDPPPVCDCGA